MAVEFDKWAHFGGAGVGVPLMLIAQVAILFAVDVITQRSFSDAGLMEPDIMRTMVKIDWLFVNVIGVFIEVVQGLEYDPDDPQSPDGFSFMDLIANMAGSGTSAGALLMCL